MGVWFLWGDGNIFFPKEKLRCSFLLLRAVEHLHIHNCNHIIAPEVFSTLTNVRELKMGNIHLTSLEDTLAVVYAFPKLETLLIYGISIWGVPMLPLFRMYPNVHHIMAF